MNIDSQMLLSFINEFTARNYTELPDDMDIESGLKITGDDAIDFLEDFSKRFNVDVSELNVEKYFTSEGFMLNFNHLMKKMKGIDIPPKNSLTIGDLKKAIESKRLN